MCLYIGCAIYCCFFDSFLVCAVSIYMYYYFLGLVVSQFLFSFLEKSVDHVYLLLLLLYGFGQTFSLFFILCHVLLMLADTLFILIDNLSMSILKQLDLSNKMGYLLLESRILSLKLFIWEGCWLNVFVNYFLDFNYLLYNSLYFYRSLDINWLYLDLSLHFSAILQILS